jgi:hypothetical protein
MLEWWDKNSKEFKNVIPLTNTLKDFLNNIADSYKERKNKLGFFKEIYESQPRSRKGFFFSNTQHARAFLIYRLDVYLKNNNKKKIKKGGERNGLQ